MSEDTYDLLQHIAWTDVILPKLQEHTRQLSTLLVSEALGTPLPTPLTREKVAGMCYGIQYITSLLERVIRNGEKAVSDLNHFGVHLHKEI